MTEKNRRGKPALSLWALLAKNSIVKITAVLLGLAAGEGILFYGRLQQGVWVLDAVLAGSHISGVFLTALGLTVFILAWTQGRLDRQSGAVMERLRLSGRDIYLIRTAYNILCMVLLFAVQIWLCILLIALYGKETAEGGGFPQRLFLAFYRSEFLHCLLPMAEMGKWVRNILLLLAFGTETAAGRGRKNGMTLVLLYVVTVSWFVSSLGGELTDFACGGVYAVVIAVNVWRARKKNGGEAGT